MKKKFVLFFTILLVYFLYSFYKNTSVVFADLACDPYSCMAQHTYLYVGSCQPSSGYNCQNVSGSVEPGHDENCNTGGGPGSCIGPAPGVETCGGNVYQTATSTTCICPDLSSCTTQGSACPYGGTCNCTPGGPSGSCAASTPGGGNISSPGCPAGSCPPRDGTRGCCYITSTPPPTPPPSQENCYHCVSSSCTLYTVPAGTCSTNCSACTPTPPPPPPSGTNCTVTLSPSSVNLYTDSSPYNITAIVSNVTGGTVSQVEFSKSNSNITMNPVFDTNGAPYQSSITPNTAGTTTLTAKVYFNGIAGQICQGEATVTVSTPPITQTNPAPECEAFSSTAATVVQGQSVTYTMEITDEAKNELPDGGFEQGNMTYWPIAHQLNEFYAVPNSGPTYSAGAEGAYYAKISRQNPAPATPPAFDPHGATGFVDTGSNVKGQTYTVKFLAKSHEYYGGNSQGNVRVPGIVIQSSDFASAWAPWPQLVNYEWREFSYNLTMPTGTANNTLRMVIRPPENYPNPWHPASGFNYWPIYYDSVKVYKTADAGVNASTVRLYYHAVDTDYCDSGWLPANNSSGTNVATNSGGGIFTHTWDTSSITPGSYVIAVNAADIGSPAEWATGNPSGICTNPPATWTSRPACNIPQTVTACTPTCGGTTCGNTDQTPGNVTGITVTGISGNTLNLSTNPAFPKTISWTAPTITSPGVIAEYEVWLVPRGSNPATCTGTCRNLGTTTSTSISLPSVLAAQTDEFDIKVRAVNGCGTTSASWGTRQVNLFANVTGTIYDAVVTPNGSNNCTMPNPTPSTLDISAGYLGMTGSQGGSVTTAPGSSYTFTAPYAPTGWPKTDFNLTLNLNSSDPAITFYCSCPDGGGSPFNCAHTLTDSPMSNQHFFVSTIDLSNGPWWQTKEGNAYGTASFTNSIPQTCEDDVNAPICDANIVVQNTAGDSKSAGIPLSGGTITSNGFYTAYDGTSQPHANNTQHTNMVKENYDYYAKNINLGSFTSIGATITAIPTSNGQTYDDATLYYRNGDLTFNMNSNLTVASGTKKIIFVNGNVTINGTANQHRLTVADGGYFAIIASGNITFNNSVGNVCTFPSCSNTTTNIDGVYIASGDLIIEDDNDDAVKDNIFIGEGTFVGWQGIQLNRSFDNTSDPIDRAINNEYPTNIFRFRPDFTENTPEVLRHPNIVWQEVN